MNNNNKISKTARITATTLALVTLAGLVIRFILAAEQHGSVLAGASHLYQFFTIVTNSLVFLVMAAIGLGKTPHRLIVHATVVAIIGVGIIFHALLSQFGAREGLDGLGNLITHTIVPIASLVWWLAHSDKEAVEWRDAFFSLICPGGYTIYALTRAEFSGFYPYAFIDLQKLGWGGLAQSVFFLGLAFFALALLTIAYARIAIRLKAKPSLT